ncbi:MAG: methyl-accepting chemotaxis protein [Eubacteriales bacterium]
MNTLFSKIGTNFKNRYRTSLSFKLASALAFTMVVIIGTLVIISIVLPKLMITDYVSREFKLLANINSIKIQDVVKEAEAANEITANNVMNLMRLKESNKNIMMVTSNVYNSKIMQSAYDAESYYIDLFWATVENSSVIDGMSVKFAPYVFSENIERYGIRISDTMCELYGDFLTTLERARFVYYEEDFYETDNYIIPTTTRETFISDPHYDEERYVVSVSTPIIYGGEVVAVVTTDVDLTAFNHIEASNDDYPTMFVSVFNDRMKYIMNASEQDASAFENRDYYENFSTEKEKAEFDSNIVVGEAFDMLIYGYRIFYTPINIGGVTWWIQNGVLESDLFSNVTFLSTVMIVLSIVALLLILAITSKQVVKGLAPLENMVKAADFIAMGDFDHILAVDSEDEIGVLSEKFNVMSDTLGKLVGEIQGLLLQMENGKFDIPVSGRELYVGDLITIHDSFLNIESHISQTMYEIQDTAKQVADYSEKMSNDSREVADGAVEQHGTINELLEAIKSITGKIADTEQNTAEASQAGETTGGIVKESAEKMSNLMESIEHIKEASTNIAMIIQTVDEIASQTNILALNASVEAARAGASGRGFTVVASEISKLSLEVGAAAESTQKLINTSLIAVDQGMELATQTNEIFSKVENSTEEVLGLIDKIEEATRKQLQEVGHVENSVSHIATVVQTNATASRETAEISDQLLEQAKMLNELVERFELKERD